MSPVQVFLFYDLGYENMINKSHKVRASFDFANMIGSNEVSAYVPRRPSLPVALEVGFLAYPNYAVELGTKSRT